jgi:hypothetical protein
MVIEQYEFILPTCPVREGEGKMCPWYVTGCIHPDIPEGVSKGKPFSEIQRVCRGSLPRTAK